MASALAAEIHHRGAREAAIFCERHIEELLNIKPSADREQADKDLRALLARNCHSNYIHCINSRELDVKGLADHLNWLRSNMRSIKIRVRQIVVDQDDMRHARVGFVYDTVIEREHHSKVSKTKSKDSDGSGSSKSSHSIFKHDSGSHHSIEERRSTGIGVAKIVHSKIERVDLAMDTEVLKSDPTELGCSIM